MPKAVRILLVVLLMVGFLKIHASQAAVVVLQDGYLGYTGTRDTYIASQTNKQHDDFGDAKNLLIRRQTDNEKRGLVSFDLSGLPSYGSISSINSATFSLYKSSGDQKAYSVTAYRITSGAWQEGDGANGTNDHADWAHRVHDSSSWNTAGLGNTDIDTASGVTTVITSNKAWYDWTVTSIVDGWWSGANPNYGFYLLATGSEGERSFHSSEYTNTPSLRLKLAIDYTSGNPPPVVPEPMSLSLFGLGVVGLFGIRRKRRV